MPTANTLRATHNFVFAINICQLPGYFLSAIRASVVHDDNLPCKLTRSSSQLNAQRLTSHALFCKDLGQKPNNYRQILALVICGQNNRVFVCIRCVVVALHGDGYVVGERVHQR
jgi:hypothetical protein